MNMAIAESLQREVDVALQEAAKHRGGLQRRVAAACNRIRRQQALVRAEALAPSFRAYLLRRARAIQKNRAQLLQTLRRFAGVLPAGDLRGQRGLLNVVTVLRAVRESLAAEEGLACWRQSLPCEGGWNTVCSVVRDGGRCVDASPQQAVGSGTKDEKHYEDRLEAALERALAPPVKGAGAEEDEAVTAPPSLCIVLPCFCTMAHFCRHNELQVVAAAVKSNSKGNNTLVGGVREEDEDVLRDEAAETEKSVSGDSQLTQRVLDASAAHLGRLGFRESKESDGAERNHTADEEVIESALEEARLRVSMEVAARVSACRHAVESLVAEEDGILLDGLTTVMASAPLALPVMTLVLPPMEQLFFCIAYTLGAAILRDEQNEQHAVANGIHAPTVADDVDDDVCGSGWRGALERWIREERSVDNASSAFVGLRLLQYLLDYVFCPAVCDSHQRGVVALVEPTTARRWLELALMNTPDGDATIDAMMTLYMKKRH